MANEMIAPYGSWRSPISSALIVSSTIRLGQVRVDGENIYWIEGRPTEGGRSVIVRRAPDGKVYDVTPPPFNARTRAHEYGGGDFAVADGVVYFANFADQRLYRVAVEGPDREPKPITPEGDTRYADMIVDRGRGWVIFVREDHTAGGHEPTNTLALIDLAGDRPTGAPGTETPGPETPDRGDSAGGMARTLASGNDFYSSPCLSPDGSMLAWLTWNHPNMPWDGTELWMGALEPDGSIRATSKIAGGPEESIFQPRWSPDGTLYFISDRNGWWNLYRWNTPVETRHVGSPQPAAGLVEPVVEMAAEFGLPQWVFGMSTYAFAPDGRIICSFGQGGRRQLALIDTATREIRPIQTSYSEIRYCDATPAPRSRSGGGSHAVLIAGSPAEASAILRLNLQTEEIEVLRRSSSVAIDQRHLSLPQAIEYPTENGRTAYAFYYPAKNGDYAGPAGELPPLIVRSHGGPTSAASTVLDLGIQFWTSRGIAVLDVNYGGSTGYGRAYRQRLDGQWGIVDVDDCVNGARYLADWGLVDGNRLAITGGSAGGYTTLCALTFRDMFKAGASHYGVGDLEALARDTHKFEAHYLDRLIGPYPQRRDLYVERSPIHYADRLSCPVILLQGLDDKVVPPNQAELMVQAMRAKGLPFAYVTFEGEGHGFRRADSIKRALEAELYFYSRIFGFELAEPVEPVEIENV